MKLKDYLLISLVTILSPLIYGYYFGVIDHHHYLPYLNKILNSSLYPTDYFFSQPHFSYSPFNYFITGLSQLTNLNLAWIHLILYFICLWLLYYSVYRLSFTFYQKTSTSLLALTLFLLPKWAAQIGYLTHHFYFVSRDLSLAVALIALSFILKNQWLKSVLLLALAAIINPSIPIPVGLFWLLRLLLKTSQSRFVAIVPIGQKNWLNILQNRGTYSFPHLWKWTGWGNLGLFFSLLVTSFLVLNKKIFNQYFKEILQFIGLCLSLFVFHFIISAIIPIPELIQLQLLRALNYIFILSLISFAASLNQLFDSKSIIIQLTAILAYVGVYFWGDHLTVWHFMAILILPLTILLKPKPSFKFHFRISPYVITTTLIGTSLLIKLLIIKPQINLPYFIYYPNSLINLSQYKASFDLQSWAKHNTTVDSVFLIPPNLPGFRSFSERSIVADLKDGGVIFYSPDYANDWQQRMVDLQSYRDFNLDDFIKLSTKYPFNYLVVTQKHQPIELPIVFQNQEFKIYQI
jgi:hypothetical protein